MTAEPRPCSSLPAAGAVPAGGGQFGVDLVTKIMVYAIFALSLELLVGSTGLVCFGQAAFFGIGAYAAVLLSPEYDAGQLLWLLPASRGWRRRPTRCSWARCRCAPRACTSSWSRWPSRRWPTTWCTTPAGRRHRRHLPERQAGAGAGWQPLDLDKPLPPSTTSPGLLVAVFGFLALLLRSRFGRALAASGQRAAHARHRLLTYPTSWRPSRSGAHGRLAGFLFAVKDGFVNPELLSWHLSGAVLIMIILGGLGHLRGALIGAFAFALLQEFFKSEAIFGAFAKHWHLGLGLTIIASVALLPRGLVGLPAQWRAAARPHAAQAGGGAR
jgi:branched-chain amino acid transport system permease protein